MKKLVAIALLLAFVLTLAACGAPKTVSLGTSDLSIVLPAGYALTEDDMDEDQVGYYYKDDNSVDFDVYQWEKGDEYTLASEANHYAAEYGTVAEAVTFNGIHGMKYVSEEEYEGVVYTVLNYIFEDDVYLVELCFWTNATAAEYAVVEEILNTLKMN
jgi:hypothetical protein